MQSLRGADPVRSFGGALEWSGRHLAGAVVVVGGGAGEVKRYKL